MSSFYRVLEEMKNLVCGDMSQETLVLAELEYLANPDMYDDVYLEPNRPSEELTSGSKLINGSWYIKYIGADVNACWCIGDYYYDQKENFVQIPDSWDSEDLRQDDTIYRPYTRQGKGETCRK